MRRKETMKKERLKLFFLSLVLSIAVILGGTAQGMEWGDGKVTLNGFIKNQTGYRFGFYDDERGSGLSMFRNTLQLEGEAKFNETTSLYVIGRGVRETGYHLERRAVDAGNFNDDVYNEGRLREYYLAWQATKRVWLGLGKQQVVWGDLGGMGLRVMDIINPLDLRWHYALEDFESMRKPLNMLNAIVSVPEVGGNIQLVWVPAIDEPWERVNSIYANPGHRYAINSVPAGSLFGPPAFITPDGSRFSNGTVKGVWEPKTFALGVPEDDEADPANIKRDLSQSTIAISWEQKIGGLNYRLMECYTYNHAPAVYWQGSPLLGAPANIKYFRQNIIGVSANYYEGWSKSVLRTEIGHFHNVPYTADKRLMIGGWGGVPNPDFYHLERKDTIKFGFGWDRNTFFNFLSPTRSVSTSFQVLGTWILNHDKDLIDPGYNTKVKELDIMLTLFMNWGWNNDRMQINLYPAYNVSRRFGMLMAWIDYKPQWLGGGNVTFTPKVNLFYGKDPWAGDFGLVRGSSEVLLEVKYEF